MHLPIGPAGGSGRPPESAAHRVATLTIVPLAGRTGFRLIGEVDLFTRPGLEEALCRIADDSDDVHVDLADLTFIDVGGMTALAGAAARLNADQQLVLHHPPGEVRRILSLLWGHLRTTKMSLP
jgi:anti-anti-sigma factor